MKFAPRWPRASHWLTEVSSIAWRLVSAASEERASESSNGPCSPRCSTWLPLLILSLTEELAYGTAVKVTFLRDFAVNARFLVALPILILAEPRIDRLVAHPGPRVSAIRLDQPRRARLFRGRHRANHSAPRSSASRRRDARRGVRSVFPRQDRIAHDRSLELARRRGAS